MVRVLAFMVAKSLAEDSLMQAHDVDILGVQGNSQVGRLAQHTKEMEAQYKAMLENIVQAKSWDDPNTGKPFSPTAELLSPVNDILGQMEGQLKQQQTLNTNIMAGHTAAVKACNTQLASALSSIVSGEKADMVSKRTSHSTCRGQEDSAIATMESSCGAFETLRDNKCGSEQDWYADYQNGVTGTGTLADLVSKADTCRANVATLTTKANECDTAQTNFQSAWCEYKTKLTEACSTHDTCYSQNEDNWNRAEEAIQKLEEEQKIIYRMLGRIRCYINLLMTRADGGASPTQEDINTCQATAVTDTPLDITYGSVEARPPCLEDSGVSDEPLTPAPGAGGDPTWYNREFGGMTDHGKLQPETAC